MSSPAFISAEEPAELKSTPLAKEFGTAPIMWGVQFSPDGTKFSAIQMHPSGTTLARVIGLGGGTDSVVLSSGNEAFTVDWCEWAKAERLLCGLHTMSSNAGDLLRRDADGGCENRRHGDEGADHESARRERALAVQ